MRKTCSCLRGETTVGRGNRAESLAVAFLLSAGYQIVARNVRGKGGEIDVIAWDGDVLCFIEVRARSSTEFGDPLETIDRRKIRRVVCAARQYLATLPPPWPDMRFDAVGIVFDRPPAIALVKGAFEA